MLDDKGTLTISGTGAMDDYSYWGTHWEDHDGDILRVVIEEDVTSVGNNAFNNCNSLAQVTIPNSVQTIGEKAFIYCSAMPRLTLGSGVVTIGASAFYDCDSLTSLTIPDSVVTIGASAFAECSGLAQVIIGSGVTTVGESAFNDCYALKDLTLGSNIITIGDHAFDDCYNLTGKLVIPDSVTTIGDSAFNNCNSLVNVVIPDNVTSLGECAFESCGSLERVSLGNGLTTISAKAFRYCSKLAHITIPEGVETIGKYAFYACRNLVSITIPESVTLIQDGVFGGSILDGTVTLEDVYYGGTEAQWQEILISKENEGLTDALFHYNSYAGDVWRLAGAHRWATAQVVAEETRINLGVEKLDAIIIASGNDFADALAGSYLSTVKNAPILLSWGKGGSYKYLDTDNIDYIKTYLAADGTVYILGGENAVPALYEEQLSAYTVKRLGGANRFETNLMILEEAGVAEGSELLVCTATNFADSLSASATGKPILLVWNERGQLYGNQPGFLADLKNCTFTVIGGESAVGAKLATAIETYGEVERLAGANRFETSVMVANKYFDAPETAVLAYAWNYPDGLCGGTLAYSMNAPLVLTMTKYEAKAVAYANEAGIEVGAVLGGDGLISDGVVRSVFAMEETEFILLRDSVYLDRVHL